ncbi:DUF885 family protein [Caulobacter sp. 73W]|uniref:DUF885 family protein n=1 Tax=Caulobacter sp. 73W TaxID=3161137 RepID=A0AB39KTQ5_9CAUL
MDRRQVLIGAAAALGLPHVGLAAGPGSGDAALARLLDEHARALRDEAGTADRLRDYSMAARAAAGRAARLRLAQLDAIRRQDLSAASAIDHDVARFVQQALTDQYARYGSSDINLRPSPYVVSQMNGAYYWLPASLARRPLSAGDGQSPYLDALGQLARALDQETAQIGHDAQLGVVPPRFILAKTLRQIAQLRDTPLAQNPLTAPAIAGAPAGFEAKVTQAFERQVAQALTRQIEALEAMRPKADDRAGVWAQPGGAAYYASALSSNTTTSYDPAELHARGLQWVEAITAQIDVALRAEGLREGSIAQRMAALDRDPRFVVADSDAGRARILDYARGCLRKAQALTPRAFHLTPDDPVEVSRVPVAIENGAPGASYSGSDDPARKPSVTINLRSTAENALWRLPTLLHHEGVPGHHFQASVLRRAGSLSPFRRTVRFSAWTEGWALYAEQLADEIGAYEDNPPGRIGYLQGQLFRACRVVVDTGLHHARWTREQAIAWMVEHAGEQPDAAEREIDRYCVYPGQACSFMVGKAQIVASREAARKTLGARFDLRAFNDLVLGSGPLPMAVLDRLVADWAATQRS